MSSNAEAVVVPFRGVGWGDDEKESKGRRLKRAIVAAAVVALVLALLPPPAADIAVEQPTSWIVRALPGRSGAVIDLLTDRGVDAILPLPIIDGVAADLTRSEATRLAASPLVVSVTPDAPVTLTSWESGPPSDGGALHRIVDKVVGADAYWDAGFTGAGIDIAIIDSGISPVPGLDHPARVVNGPDFSFDGPQENLRHLDLYGHGTHMASIIAGSDLAPGAQPTSLDLRDSYLGVAPNARLVNVKVADAQGLADVSQVIAGIGWVVASHQDTVYDLDVRVLALAFGTDGTQDPAVDPLAYAVEQAWEAGIVVVASSGNDGNAYPIRNPASHPAVIAVGAADSMGTPSTRDDAILEFSNCGTHRTIDLVAPGKSVLGLRTPGSNIDTNHPSAVLQDRLFRGTGTSQAAAVVAGAVALVVDQRPDITPDEVKALLEQSASPLKRVDAACQGAGMLDLGAALETDTPEVADWIPISTGTGSLEAARGSHHVSHDGVVLEGEIDIFGDEWTGASWSGASWSGASWSGASWSGASWSGASWSGASWSGASWSGASWSGASWSGASWSTAAWA